MMAISSPDFFSAGGRENATSARPTDLLNGAHSLVTNRIFIGMIPFQYDILLFVNIAKRPWARSISACAKRGARFVTYTSSHKQILSIFYRTNAHKSTTYTKNIDKLLRFAAIKWLSAAGNVSISDVWVCIDFGAEIIDMT